MSGSGLSKTQIIKDTDKHNTDKQIVEEQRRGAQDVDQQNLGGQTTDELDRHNRHAWVEYWIST